MLNKMLVTLFIQPILIAVGALVVGMFLGWFVPATFEGQPLFTQLAAASIRAASPVMFFILLLAALDALFQLYNFWQWQKGNRPSCHSCGGLVALKNGRYGLYYKCYACNTTRSA